MKLILTEELKSGMVLAQDLYLSEEDTSPFISRGIILNDYVIEKIQKRGFRNAYIESSQGGEALSHIPQSTSVLSPEVRDEALESLEEMFTLSAGGIHDSTIKVVKRLDSVVTEMVDSILSERNTLVNINDLKSYDDYTYHHSLSVSVLALAMGQRIGYSPERMKELGMCAMMHDIGKTAIPVEIIRKTTRLDSSELNLIKTHSTAGHSYLVEANIGTEEIRAGVLSHHEKFDGTGYPYGISGKEIPEWSRIITVADVYDALTSNRPYRKPMEPAEAIEYIMGGADSAFDFDMVQALIKKIDLYPVGSRVELSDGTTAEVVDNENQMRPVVRFNSGEELDLFRDRSCLSLVIKRVLPEETAPVP